MPTKPETERSRSTDSTDVVLEVDDLAVHYELQGGALSRLLGLRSRTVKAVDGVDLSIRRGEVVGLVGESGSGKTTLGRALLGLVPATSGSIDYRRRDGSGGDVATMRGKTLRRLRTDLQMVFQDPHAALNPGMTIEQAIGHPLVIHDVASGAELRARVVDALDRVGLSPPEAFIDKYPGDLSGGQKQRAVIARAIILDPEVLIADEPISMLDMSVRAKILQLMLDLRDDLGLTYVFITHDLATAKYFCDRVAIMYLGRIVEIGDTAEIFANPRHPYTKALLAAIPDPDPDREVARDLPRGEIPDAADPPLGCSFHPRCPEAVASCGWESRDLRALLEQHWTRRTPQEYADQVELVGDLSPLDRPATSAVIRTTSPDRVLALLDEVRAEAPDDPFWTGATVTGESAGVRIDFAEGEDPALRRTGGVEVACVLYPAEGSTAD